jgi:hypothetical protein
MPTKINTPFQLIVYNGNDPPSGAATFTLARDRLTEEFPNSVLSACAKQYDDWSMDEKQLTNLLAVWSYTEPKWAVSSMQLVYSFLQWFENSMNHKERWVPVSDEWVLQHQGTAQFFISYWELPRLESLLSLQWSTLRLCTRVLFHNHSSSHQHFAALDVLLLELQSLIDYRSTLLNWIPIRYLSPQETEKIDECTYALHYSRYYLYPQALSEQKHLKFSKKWQVSEKTWREVCRWWLRLSESQLATAIQFLQPWLQLLYEQLVTLEVESRQQKEDIDNNNNNNHEKDENVQPLWNKQVIAVTRDYEHRFNLLLPVFVEIAQLGRVPCPAKKIAASSAAVSIA